MNHKVLIGAALLSVGAIAWAAKDPVVMTVNGVDVPLSEFKYLYYKNSQQQMNDQPIGDYVELFTNYKLKVADARSMGIDTTSAFRQEMSQYRSDLAAPYLADSVFLNQLVSEAFDRSGREVQVSHIMLFKNANRVLDEKARTRLDSIRRVALNGGDFAELAAEFSQDGTGKRTGGSLGYIAANRYPYNFEKAAFALQPGEISEIVESPMAYHIIKAGESRPATGSVLVSHVLKLVPMDAPQAQQDAVKASIDSLYNLAVANPDGFADLAMRNSDDPGSAKKGGQLPWFGSGMMVPEFEEAAFSMKNGEICKPFRTSYGWHFIKKHDSRGPQSLEEMRPQLLQRIQHPQDERSEIIRERQTEVLAKKHKGRITSQAREIASDLLKNGLDSAFYQKYSSPQFASTPVVTIGKKNRTIGEFLPMMRHLIQPDGISAEKEFNKRLNRFFNSALVDAEIDWLEANEPDYRNLYHEYYDGSLLYEASVRNVWDRAAKDTEGLEKYFADHRGDYTWTEPRAKGFLVQARNDSVAKAIMARSLQLPADSLQTVLRQEFKGDVKIDRVLVSKGTNAMVDFIMFGGPKVQPSAAGFTEYFMLDGRLITAPEELGDVRAMVTSDYQAMLEDEWLKSLRAKYPVTVNEKVLGKVKPLDKK